MNTDGERILPTHEKKVDNMIMDLSQRIKLGVPENDLDAVAMIHTCANVYNLSVLEEGELFRCFIVSRRNHDGDTQEAYMWALDYITRTYDVCSKFRNYVDCVDVACTWGLNFDEVVKALKKEY